MIQNKSINIKTENFKQNLLKLINSSGLPVANVYFVFQLVEKELEKTYYATLNQELIESSNQEEKNTEENNEKEEE